MIQSREDDHSSLRDRRTAEAFRRYAPEIVERGLAYRRCGWVRGRVEWDFSADVGDGLYDFAIEFERKQFDKGGAPSLPPRKWVSALPWRKQRIEARSSSTSRST